MDTKILTDLLPFFILGFISIKMWELINPMKVFKASEIYLELFFLASLYKYLSKFEIQIKVKEQFFNLSYLFLFIFAIISPYILKLILKTNFIRQRIIKTSMPTSWDFLFEKREAFHLKIHLKDCEKPIVAYYGENSFASSYPYKNCLFLEKTFELKKDEQGEYILTGEEESQGILINEENIKYIEVKNYER